MPQSRINSNQLIEDREISYPRGCHYRKIIGLAIATQTNSYYDLSNIPTTFKPIEHTNQHPIVTLDRDGMISSQIFDKLSKIKNYSKFRFDYDVESQDIHKGYTDVHKTVPTNLSIIEGGTDVILSANTNTNEVIITGKSLDLDKVQVYPGPQGPQGQSGKNGKYWLPNINQNTHVIQWTLTSGDIDPRGKNFNVKGPRGDKGKTGVRGFLPMFNKIIENPFYGRKGEIFCCTNSKDLKPRSRSAMIVWTNMTVFPITRVQEYFMENLTDVLRNKFRRFYNLEQQRFYIIEWDSVLGKYDWKDLSEDMSYYAYPGQIIYDTYYDNMYYVHNSYKLIQI